MQRKVLIVGDSHLAALVQPLRQLSGQDALAGLPDVSLGFLGGGNLLREPFSRRIPGGVELFVKTQTPHLTFIEAAESCLAVGIYANFHTGTMLKRQWDRFAPAVVAGDEYPISHALFLEMLRSDQRYLLEFIEHLQQAGIRVFAIESPGPFHHHLAMARARLEVWTYIDKTYRDFIAAELTMRSVDIVRLPDDCVDALGFTLPQFRSPRQGDRVHANEVFGEVMLHRMLDYIRTLAPAAQTARLEASS